ncbi:ATP synthase subunit I [Thalassotalea piscium]|uniref:ATP synthase protein I n=1 Tax=Thalassotalea piscium TaxID=1230533 RepID=A0A7X0TTQ5_9GAMM|nr:ATP synthase subunit I [Thalassotalea piscium]MBB6543512.1 ATP synthase protein I [Thalassotalea piscium]
MNAPFKSDLAKTGRKFAFKQIIITTVLVLLGTITTYFYWGLSQAQSVLAGGVVVIIPNIVFALKAFRYAGARSSEKVMESFYSGEKLKIVLTAILFALAFKFLAIMPIPFFISFCLVVVLPLLTPFFIKL